MKNILLLIMIISCFVFGGTEVGNPKVKSVSTSYFEVAFSKGWETQVNESGTGLIAVRKSETATWSSIGSFTIKTYSKSNPPDEIAELIGLDFGLEDIKVFLETECTNRNFKYDYLFDNINIPTKILVSGWEDDIKTIYLFSNFASRFYKIEGKSTDKQVQAELDKIMSGQYIKIKEWNSGGSGGIPQIPFAK